MGTGAGENSGVQPAITPDMLAPEGDDRAAEARRMRELAEATLQALGKEPDPLHRHLAQMWWEAAVKYEEAETFYQAGRADGRAECPVPIPDQRKPRSHRGPGGSHLKRIKSLIFPLAAAGALRAGAGRIGRHGAAAKMLGAHASLKAAAFATAGTAATALAITGAVVISSPGHGTAGPDGGTGAAPAASAYAAVPFPVPSTPMALLVTHPEPKHGKSLAGVDGTGLPAPCCTTGTTPSTSSPSSSSASQSSSAPSVGASVDAGPITLSVSATSLNLTSTPSAVITLSADGGAWQRVRWDVDTTNPLTQTAQTDLDFSQTNGVLYGGESVTITVTLDPAQAIDGNLSETFTIGGQSVTAAMPALPLPSAVPTVIPSLLPSVLPS